MSNSPGLVPSGYWEIEVINGFLGLVPRDRKEGLHHAARHFVKGSAIVMVSPNFTDGLADRFCSVVIGDKVLDVEHPALDVMRAIAASYKQVFGR